MIAWAHLTQSCDVKAMLRRQKVKSKTSSPPTYMLCLANKRKTAVKKGVVTSIFRLSMTEFWSYEPFLGYQTRWFDEPSLQAVFGMGCFKSLELRSIN